MTGYRADHMDLFMAPKKTTWHFASWTNPNIVSPRFGRFASAMCADIEALKKEFENMEVLFHTIEIEE